MTSGGISVKRAEAPSATMAGSWSARQCITAVIFLKTQKTTY